MPDQNNLWDRHLIQLEDGGSLYAETNIEHFIVEPWNAWSSLLFLIPALFWAFKIRKTFRENAFIAYCVPLLILGGLGSTLFHAFRSSPFLLQMDVLPILFLTLSVSAFFWQKVTKNWWITAAIVVTGFFLRRLVVDFQYFSYHTAANFSYFIAGVTIFTPVLVVLFKSNFEKGSAIITSILCFVVALLCREIDTYDISFLPMGTHFLWHFFCAAGAYYIAKYLYKTSPEMEEVGEPQYSESKESSFQ